MAGCRRRVAGVAHVLLARDEEPSVPLVSCGCRAIDDASSRPLEAAPRSRHASKNVPWQATFVAEQTYYKLNQGLW